MRHTRLGCLQAGPRRAVGRPPLCPLPSLPPRSCDPLYPYAPVSGGGALAARLSGCSASPRPSPRRSEAYDDARPAEDVEDVKELAGRRGGGEVTVPERGERAGAEVEGVKGASALLPTVEDSVVSERCAGYEEEGSELRVPQGPPDGPGESSGTRATTSRIKTAAPTNPIIPVPFPRARIAGSCGEGAHEPRAKRQDRDEPEEGERVLHVS